VELAELTAWVARLGAMDPATSEVGNVSRIRVLEELKAVCAAAQAREAVALHDSRREADAARGVPAAQRGRGVAAEIALARRDSPARGSRHLGLARALVDEMPHTMAALRAGAISEWRATLVARETGWLPVEGRVRVDELIAPRLTVAGDRALAAEAQAFAQAWDPAEAVRHLRRAEGERRVSIRPAPDTMVYLTALVPMVPGIAAWAALDRDAKSLIGTGEAGGRGRGQVMADLLVTRLTGQATAGAVPVEVHLVMTDMSLLGNAGSVGTDGDGGDVDPAQTPAWVVGHGPIPAAAARDLLDPAHDEASGRARVWLRRLFTDPESGQLVAMDSRRRLFDGQLRRMVVLRDDTCRTPWCDAPIRHGDHADPHRDGGDTTFVNGSGLCERCNHGKETPGWRHHAGPDRLTVTTPTGHTYTTTGPPLVRGLAGRTPGSPEPSTIETRLAEIVDFHYHRRAG